MSGPGVLIPADVRFPLERANGVQIVKTAAALARAGARPTLFVRQSDPRPTDEVLGLYGVAGDGLQVERVPVMHRRGWNAIPRALFLSRATLAARRAAAAGAVVFTRDLQLAEVLIATGQPRVVYEAHAVEALMYQERAALYGTAETPHLSKVRRLQRREGRVWRGAAGFVTTTAGIRDAFAERYGERPGVRVIANGCDVPADRNFPGLAAGEPPRVLYAGQMYPWKGVDVLVDAMVAVPQARLVLLGGLPGERDLERVRARVDAAGLTARTEMQGTVPQARVIDEVRRAAVIVVPFLRTAMTERHTSPLKAFEAMAAGRPLVVTDLPSSREFLTHERNALLVPPGDAAAVGGAVERLLRDRPLAERLARQAYVDAEAFSWDARARQLVTLFDEVR